MVADKLLTSQESLNDTKNALRDVAKFYADKDAEYYEQFGYLQSEMD